MTQYIKDGSKKNKITEAAFVDPSAAHDTVNHQLLLKKVNDLAKGFRLMELLRSMLKNRRFYVTPQARNSRLTIQKERLP